MAKQDKSTESAAYWRTLGNSPGLWIFLFAAFGLLFLNMGEEKIQRRMLRYGAQVAGQQAKTPATAGAEAGADANSSENRQAVPTNTPYQYRLTGLRWILGIAAALGLIILFITALAGRLSIQGSGDTTL